VSVRATFIALVVASAGAVAIPDVVAGSEFPVDRVVSVTVAPPTTMETTPVEGESEPAPEPTAPVGDSVPEGGGTVPPDDSGTGEPGTGDEPDDVVGDVTETPARAQPTVRTTDIAPASIVLAIAVLAAAVLAWRIGHRRRGPPPVAAGPAVPAAAVAAPQTPGAVDTMTLGFLLELGEALVDAGDAVHNVTGTLEGVARVNGKDGIGAIVLPTALIISIPGAVSETTDVAIAGRSRLRLDQIESLMNVVDRAERGELAPVDGRRELRAIRARPHPYSVAAQLAGSAVAAAGLALVLRGGVEEMMLAAVLGVLVGMINQATASARFLYRPFWPLLASFVVSTATFTALRLADIVAFPALIAPLITFLPGALLTIAVLELATGQILAGSARLASGSFQLVLLALGIVAGAQLVGVPASAVGSAPEGPVALAGPWAGVAVFGIGIVWSQGLRRASIPAILIVLYVAYAGQVVGGVFVGSGLSSFFGAVAMTPVAVLLARQGLGPPTLVAFFPGFWILVPGALGLEGVTRIISDDRFAATGALTTALTSMVGIALGVLLGLALAAPDPERPWMGGGRRQRIGTRRG
jgi:uncharacterized membrane protein YjjP (DUF1212 family)